METQSPDKFEELLNSQYQWPTRYLFKFIVPKASIQQVSALFPAESAVFRPSAGGKYVSATFDVMCSSAQDVLRIYEAAAKINGIIAL